MALLNKCFHFSLIPCFLYVYPSWTSYFFLWGQENFNVPQQCSSYSFWNNQWPLSCPESHGPVVYQFLNLLWDYSTIEKPFFSCSARLQYLNSLNSDGQGLFLRSRAAQLPVKHASSPGQVLCAYVQRDSRIVRHDHFPCEGQFHKDRPHF